MSKGRNIPIILGHLKNGKSDKCILANKDENSVKIALCRLKTDKKSVGDKIEMGDIDGIIQEFWICRKETLKILISTLQSMYDKWE